MQRLTKEIDAEVYEAASKNLGHIPEEYESRVFNDSILYGYGLYGTMCYQQDGRFYCDYVIGSTND